jgi:hypothetical protein
MSTLSSDKFSRLPVSRVRISSVRDLLEVSPIEIAVPDVGLVKFDFDEKAQARMQLAISQWESISKLPGDKVPWTLADNTVLDLTLAQLTAIYEGCQPLIAARASVLHMEAQVFKNSENVTERDMIDWAKEYNVILHR